MRSICALVTAFVSFSVGPAPAIVVWGDVHAHSGLSDDATGEPEEFFRVAREVARLDFVVLSDHDVFLTADEWQRVNEVAASFDEPGRFVAFAGVEWTHAWHLNIYFESHEENICGDKAVCDLGDDFEALQRLYEPRVGNDSAAAHINHPSAIAPIDWSSVNDAFATNVEMWNSLWNIRWAEFQPPFNENSLGGPIWALHAGYRLGFVGVSDDHFVGRSTVLLGTGLTACHVDSLNRAEVLRALRNRRCYASNGPRIEAEFDVDGTPMGGELEAPLNSQVIAHLTVRGPEAPESIEIFRNGRVVARKTDCAAQGCSFYAPVWIRDEHTFLHARVRLSEERFAWISPIWVRGLCVKPEDCPATRLAPGGNDPKTSCFSTWRVLPGPDRDASGSTTNRVTCVDGDPSCDFGFADGACTFRVGTCVGLANGEDSPCRLGELESYRFSSVEPDEDAFFERWRKRQFQAAFNVLGRQPAPGSCTPYFDVHVTAGEKRRRRKDGEKHLISRAKSNGGLDRDRLTLVCKAKQGVTGLAAR